MKNITKTIITAVLLLLTVGLFAQEDSTKVIVKDAQGISTGMTQKEFDLFKKDYFRKMDKLGMFKFTKPSKVVIDLSEDDKQIRLNNALNYKINLNAVQEYNNIGIDIVKMAREDFLKTGEQDLEKKLFTQDIIVTGEVIDSLIIINSKPSMCLNSVFKMKVDELIKGQELFNGMVPDTLVYYSSEGTPGLLPGVQAKIGQKQIFMFQSNFKIYSKMKATIKYHTTPELKNYSTNFYDKTVLMGSMRLDIEQLPEVRKRVNQIQAINKSADFYRRKY